MNKKHFIIFFVLLFVISIIAIFNNSQLVAAFNDPNKDKIKIVAEEVIKEAGKKTEKIASVAIDKIQDIAGSTYGLIKEKGGEVVGATIIEPSMGVARDLVKKALSSASSLLTDEDIKEILSGNKNNNCNCK
jgi:hypothetical protein